MRLNTSYNNLLIYHPISISTDLRKVLHNYFNRILYEYMIFKMVHVITEEDKLISFGKLECKEWMYVLNKVNV